MADTAPPRPRSLPALIGRWTAEVLLVFIGAYAAFWLNTYQEHQHEARRHDQILAALENEVGDNLTSAKAERERQTKRAAEFRQQVEAGQMPRLRTLAFTSDYSATDVATLLQSGGYELLDVKTIFALLRPSPPSAAAPAR